MRSLRPAWWLLLWTLAAPLGCNGEEKITINVTESSGGIKLTCSDNKYHLEDNNKETIDILKYKDENTGEYTCVGDEDAEGPKIFVKFRTCDNCIELDVGSIMGIVVGDVVATVVLGVAVYLIASQSRPAAAAPHKKRSDREHLVLNEMPGNLDYQPLNLRGKKDTYDYLQGRK